MTVSAALVLFAIIWFMTLFVALPIRMKSQGDTGEVVPGTPASAPDNPMLKRKVIWVTIATIPIWLFSIWLITSGPITLEQFDFYNGISPEHQ